MRTLLFAVSVLLPLAAWGACAPITPFCQKLPERGSKNTAIFVGVVKEVRDPPPAMLQAGSAVEKRYPVARLQVLENFLGADAGEFEVRLSSDWFVGGVPRGGPSLTEGETWLVEAVLDQRDQQWTTSQCLRIKLVQQADEDLRVLRAWAAGARLPARVFGDVWSPGENRHLPGVRVTLRDQQQIFSATTDSRGRFSFENLEPGVYEAVADVPAGGNLKAIDLRQAWCWRVVFLAK